jgi:hypothetical protein
LYLSNSKVVSLQDGVRFSSLAGSDAAQHDLSASLLVEYGTSATWEIRSESVDHLGDATADTRIFLSFGIPLQLLEIVLPPLFAFFLVLIKNAVDSSGSLESEIVNATFPDYSLTPFSFTDYITAMRAKRVCVNASNFSLPAFPGNDGSYSAQSSSNGLDISGIFDNGFNWQVPFVKCDSRKCDFEGQDALPFCEFAILAVTGSDVGGQQRAEAFAKWIYDTYPVIAPNNPNYSLPFEFPLVQITVPKIAMGVVWQGNDLLAFNYSLRQNSTNYNAPEDEGRPTAQTTPSTGTWIDSFAREDNICAPLDGGPLLGYLGLSCTGQYIYNGVITIQRLVHDYIIDISGAALAGYTVGEAAVQFTPFPTRSYKDEGFYAAIGGMFICLTQIFCMLQNLSS